MKKILSILLSALLLFSIIPVNYVAHFYVSAVLAIISEWFINGMQEDEETLLNYIKALIKDKKAF